MKKDTNLKELITAFNDPNNVEELKELLVFGLLFGDGLNKALKDGKITVWDSLKFRPAMKAAMPAFEGLANPLDRVKALRPEDYKELAEFLADEFDIVSDNIEDLILRTLEHVCSIIELTKDWKEIVFTKKKK